MEDQRLSDSGPGSFVRKHSRKIPKRLRAIGSRASLKEVFNKPLDNVKVAVDESTIHGVKEAFYSNVVGRLFWCLIFMACAVLMTLQMQGLFNSFSGQNIGTRILKTINSEYVDVPAVHYCNSFWASHPEAMENFLRCTDGFLGSMIKKGARRVSAAEIARGALWGSSLKVEPEYRQLRHCEREYELKVLETAHVNRVLSPRNPRIRNYQWQKTGWHTFDHKVQTHFRRIFVGKILGKYNGSLYNYVKDLSSLQGKEPTPGLISGGWNSNLTFAYDNEFFAMNRKFNEEGRKHAKAVDEMFLGQMDGTISIGLNGACWKVPLGVARDKATRVIGKKYKHLVLHYGAYGYELKDFTRRYGVPTGSMSLLRAPPGTKGSSFGTIAAIATQTDSILFLENGILLTSAIGYVHLKYWSANTKYVNRRSFPCRFDWSSLDQAHCNSELQTGGWNSCQLYLPASKHYNEVLISNRTCYHDEENKHVADIVHDLRQGSQKCPHPCIQQTFEFEVTYRQNPAKLYGQSEWKWACHRAYLAMLDRDENWKNWPNTFDIESARHKSTVFNPSASSALREDIFPCTIVEYEQTEAKGLSYEEYPLHTLSEVASNFGGTLGLWTGASIMSFVQIAYVCCLRKFVRKRKPQADASETI